MTEYAECWLDDFSIGYSTNDIDVELISLFRAADKVVLTAPILNLPPQLHRYLESLEEDSSLTIIYYEASAEVVRDRLDIIGYTFETSKQAFQEWVQGELREAVKRLERFTAGDSMYKDSLLGLYQSEVEILSTLTAELWIETLKTIRASGLKIDKRACYDGPYKNTLVGYMLSKDWYGVPGYDTFVPLRLAMEAFGTGKTLVYDLTSIVWAGYFNYEDDFVELGMGISATEYNTKSKIIVLTEGKSDAWILEQSMIILFPHLRDYYSFLDFEVSSIGGGVGNLANMVKAFAGAGIVNNIIALFDNDTAATAACKSLNALKLPSNIVIRQLPELDFLKNYPTIGPSGEVNLDVNGIAASIELYLGEDVLKLDGERFAPVQWTGYERGMKQYQGEVLEKDELHKRFRYKVANWKGSLGCDWEGLRAIFGVIFSAFQEQRREAICELPLVYFKEQ